MTIPNNFNIEDIVYLKHDIEQHPRMIKSKNGRTSSELDEKIALRDSYLLIARNEESLNDEIRELQRKISELKIK